MPKVRIYSLVLPSTGVTSGVIVVSPCTNSIFVASTRSTLSYPLNVSFTSSSTSTSVPLFGVRTSSTCGTGMSALSTSANVKPIAFILSNGSILNKPNTLFVSSVFTFLLMVTLSCCCPSAVVSKYAPSLSLFVSFSGVASASLSTSPVRLLC